MRPICQCAHHLMDSESMSPVLAILDTTYHAGSRLSPIRPAWSPRSPHDPLALSPCPCPLRFLSRAHPWSLDCCQSHRPAHAWTMRQTQSLFERRYRVLFRCRLAKPTSESAWKCVSVLTRNSPEFKLSYCLTRLVVIQDHLVRSVQRRVSAALQRYQRSVCEWQSLGQGTR